MIATYKSKDNLGIFKISKATRHKKKMVRDITLFSDKSCRLIFHSSSAGTRRKPIQYTEQLK